MFSRVLTFILLISVFAACKKGEDDPKLSLRSRKSRVAGEWTMSSGHSFFKTVHENIDAYEYAFSKNSYQQTHDISNGQTGFHFTNIKNGTFSYTVKFDKNGTFQSVRKVDTTITILTGTWNFVGANNGYKDKERIVINIIHQDSGPSFISFSYSGNSTFYTYQIKELRNKKLILSSEENNMKNEANGFYSNDEYIFEQ